MTNAPFVVFGGTGFLGRRIVRHLLRHGRNVRAASRHPERVASLFSDCRPAPEPVRADIHDRASIASALHGASGAVNAVSLYVEKDDLTFHSVHVEGACRLAQCASEAGIPRLVHVSGIGADPASSSPYIGSRGEGEQAVRNAYRQVTIVRPAVMFAPDDGFLTRLAAIVRRAPVIPLFGNGSVKLQPAYAEDVAEAIARLLVAEEQPEPVYEFGGPECFHYRDLLTAIARRQNRRHPLQLPMPLAVWHAFGWIGEMLPGVPLTRNQIELMREDNVPSGKFPGFNALGIEPRPIDEVLQQG